MKIGVSNLLWTRTHDLRVAGLLNRRGIDCIDVAPTRYFPADRPPAPEEIAAVRTFWKARGIRIVGMQSLLHGTSGLALFGDEAARAGMHAHLARMIGIGAGLGATRLVFGSWQNRQRRELSLADAIARAATFFRPLAELAAGRGMQLGVEPIHAGYGNDFLVDHDEAAALVDAVDSPGFGLVLDVGCAGLAGEDLDAVVLRHGHLVGHVQLAERDLAPLAGDNRWHEVAGRALGARAPGRAGVPPPIACIEALTPTDADPLDTVAACLDVARRWYAGN
ncbi:MAG: sugar phosphate isomerase/epimerase family protein [Lautropia sp.]